MHNLGLRFCFPEYWSPLGPPELRLRWLSGAGAYSEAPTFETLGHHLQMNLARLFEGRERDGYKNGYSRKNQKAWIFVPAL
jgi:hypothetical protein